MLRWTDKTSIYRCIIIIFFYGVNVNLSEAIRAEIKWQTSGFKFDASLKNVKLT